MATINTTIPTITFTPIDANQRVDATIPEITFTKIDTNVYPPQAVRSRVPEITFTAVNASVTRGDYYELPWLVDQCRIYIEDGGVKTLASYTKRSSHWIELDSPLGAGESLWVNPGAKRPFVLGRVGDYIFTEYGAHRITAVNTAYDVELDWYPPTSVEGTYVPAQAIPAGGEKGDGKLIFGLGRSFDQIMIQVLLIPHDSVDATGSKITKIEVGYTPSGRELKTDAGG